MRKLLILDLDETLIFGTPEPMDRGVDFMVTDQYYIYKRPHLSKFLSYCLGSFSVAVWTSSTKDYAEVVVQNIFREQFQQLQFLWARERCTRQFDPEIKESYWVKNLRKLKNKGYRLESVLIVDDSPKKLQKNYGNHIHVSPYLGAIEDNELLLLIQYLEMIKDCANVRTIEKRGWKSKIQKRSRTCGPT
jgi:RNA polymerase II subunit A small phosphatase-like protein